MKKVKSKKTLGYFKLCQTLRGSGKNLGGGGGGGYKLSGSGKVPKPCPRPREFHVYTPVSY